MAKLVAWSCEQVDGVEFVDTFNLMIKPTAYVGARCMLLLFVFLEACTVIWCF